MRILLLICVMAAGCAAAACDEKLSTVAGPTPNLEPTFASVQSEIFEKTDSSGRLACTNCHTNIGRTPASGMNLLHDVAYDQIVSVPSRGKPSIMRILPGDPENSYLIHKLEGRSGIAGVRMPLGTGPFLQDGQMQILKRWIAIGAPRN